MFNTGVSFCHALFGRPPEQLSIASNQDRDIKQETLPLLGRAVHRFFDEQFASAATSAPATADELEVAVTKSRRKTCALGTAARGGTTSLGFDRLVTVVRRFLLRRAVQRP